MNYGDSQDELLLYRYTNHTANSISILCKLLHILETNILTSHGPNDVVELDFR